MESYSQMPQTVVRDQQMSGPTRRRRTLEREGDGHVRGLSVSHTGTLMVKTAFGLLIEKQSQDNHGFCIDQVSR